MSFYERLVNYFNSGFLNTFRLKNFKISTLRLYFERNNKITETLTSLGNVYRNSKWSDLKIQNIKSFFTQKHSRIIILISVVTVLLWIFSTTLGNQRLLDTFPFFTSGYELLIFNLTQLVNKFNLIIVFIYLKTYLLKTALLNYIENLKLGLLKKVENKKKDLYDNVAYVTRSKAFFKDFYPKWKDYLSFIWLESSSYLSSLKKRLISFKFWKKKAKWKDNINYAELFISTQYPLSRSTNFDAIFFRPLERTWLPVLLSDLESGYLPIAFPYRKLHKKYNPFIKTSDWFEVYCDYTQVVTLRNANRATLEVPLLSPANLNFVLTLGLAKQDRWLLRNSLISDHISKHNNSYTQTKALLGTNLTNSTQTNTNLWLSTKLSGLNLLDTQRSLYALNYLLHPNKNLTKTKNLSTRNIFFNTLTNFDFLESSRSWTLVKYVYTTDYTKNLYKLNHRTPILNTVNLVSGNYNKLLNLLLLNNSLGMNFCWYEFSLNCGNFSEKTQQNLNSMTKNNILYSNQNMDVFTSTNLNSLLHVFASKTTTQSIKSFTVKKPDINSLVSPKI